LYWSQSGTEFPLFITLDRENTKDPVCSKIFLKRKKKKKKKKPWAEKQNPLLHTHSLFLIIIIIIQKKVSYLTSKCMFLLFKRFSSEIRHSHVKSFFFKLKKLGNFLIHVFQCTLFVEIRTFVTWLKSTLLLKMKCQETHIYMKTECLQTNWDAALL